MPNCASCKTAIRGETGIRCSGVCGKVFHTTKKCSGLDQYSVGIIDSVTMVRFVCDDCMLYVFNVDLAIREIGEVVKKNDHRFKEYHSEFDTSLKHHEKEIKTLLMAVEDRFISRINVLIYGEGLWRLC